MLRGKAVFSARVVVVGAGSSGSHGRSGEVLLCVQLRPGHQCAAEDVSEGGRGLQPPFAAPRLAVDVWEAARALPGCGRLGLFLAAPLSPEAWAHCLPSPAPRATRHGAVLWRQEAGGVSEGTWL